MRIEIDWAWVLVNPHFIKYFRKCDTLNLSLANKKIRTKLYSIIFNDLEINGNFFRFHFNSNKCDYHLFDNLSISENFKHFRKYGNNNELKFKEVLLDPFIEKNMNMLKWGSKYCKSLSFKSSHSSCYYIFPIFNNFLNLRKLSTCFCEIKYTDFANLLVKLENLEILIMKDTTLILSSKDSNNLSNNLQLPVSLKELTYINVGLRATDFYQSMGMGMRMGMSTDIGMSMGMNMGMNMDLDTDSEIYLDSDNYMFTDMDMGHNFQYYINNGFDLKATLLPNLKILKFLDANPDTGRIREFIDLNPNVEYINFA